MQALKERRGQFVALSNAPSTPGRSVLAVEQEIEREREVLHWLSARAERTIETSCARVFLTGDTAWKVKRPVDFGFLDYSTVAKRRWALERELRFNRAAAPDIYRRVGALTRTDDGGLELDGPGEPVEPVLEMRRFDERAVLAEQPWAVDGDLADALGRAAARSHAGAEVRPEGVGGGGMAFTIGSNAELLTDLAPRLGEEAVERLIAGTAAAHDAARPLLDQRRAEGYVRRCHGDLHLGNILLEQGRPVFFDCIEFNDELSEIDVLYDLAFLLMDLDFRRRRDAAVRVLSSWLDEAARTFPESLQSGLSLLPLMLSVRAAVRSHVQAHNGEDGAARAYLVAALAHLEPVAPSLLAVGGLSGSGKSTFARLAAPGFGAAPGAVILRSDEIRKRLWGVDPLQPLPAEAYAADFGARVYDRMFEEAERLLAAGRAVVLDAVFLREDERRAASRLAARSGGRFEGVWLQAPADVLRQRVTERTADASDADVAVLEGQMSRDVGVMDWRVMESGDGLEAAAATIVGRLGG